MSDRIRRGPALALLATTQFVLVLDASIVGVALPSIGPDLGFKPEDLSWVANAYILTFGGLLLLGGRAADMLGRRRMFMSGLALFAVASLAGGLSTSAGMLVAARAVQGVGAALVAPAALALVMTIFQAGPDRNKAVGVFGAVAGVGGAAGSIVGGLLTQGLGWESTLWVNAPIGALMIALSPLLLPEAKDTAARGFDLTGAVTITGGLALLVYTLVDANDAEWGSAQTLGLGAAALVLITAFFVIEARAAHPLVPLRIFRLPMLRGANLVALIAVAAMMPMFFYITFYLQQTLGYGPIKAGVAQLPLALSLALVAGAASALITKLGVKIPLVAGLTILAAGLGWFSLMRADGGFLVDVLGPSLVMGVGAGLVLVAMTVGATSGVREEENGLASGLINTAQQFGGALGLAVVVAIATAETTGALNGGERVPAVALTEGYRLGMLVAAGIAAASALLALLVVPNRIPAATTEPETDAALKLAA